MSYYLCILYSLKHKRHYTGITGNPERRLNEHNSGIVPSTKPYRPYEIIYTEKHPDKTSARKKEIHLKKTAKARKELFKAIHGPIV